MWVLQNNAMAMQLCKISRNWSNKICFIKRLIGIRKFMVHPMILSSSSNRVMLFSRDPMYTYCHKPLIEINCVLKNIKHLLWIRPLIRLFLSDLNNWVSLDSALDYQLKVTFVKKCFICQFGEFCINNFKWQLEFWNVTLLNYSGWYEVLHF